MAAENTSPLVIAELIAEARALKGLRAAIREQTLILVDARYRLIAEMAQLKVEFHRALDQAHKPA